MLKHIPVRCSPSSAAFTAALAVLFGIALIPVFGPFFTSQDLYPVIRTRPLSLDFNNFYLAARNFAQSGYSSYATQVFHKPPLAGLLFQCLGWLPLAVALWLWRFTTAGVVALAVVNTARAFRVNSWKSFALLVVIAGNYPFLFLNDRANIDGISLGLGLLAAVVLNNGKRGLSMLVFAFAVGLNANVLALLPVYACGGRRGTRMRVFFQYIGAAIVLFAITPTLSMDWLAVLVERIEWGGCSVENGSIYRLFCGVGYGDQIAWWFLCVSYAAFLAGLARRNALGAPLSRMNACLLFLPFCQAYPKLAYLYWYVYFPLLLLVYCAALEAAALRVRLAAGLGIIGVLVAHFPCRIATQLSLLRDSAWRLPSLGLVCMMIAGCLLVWSPRWRQYCSARP